MLVQMDKKAKLFQNCLRLVVWLELVLIEVDQLSIVFEVSLLYERNWCIESSWWTELVT